MAQRQSGDAEGASETLEGTLTAIEESSESDSSKALALVLDVRSTKEDVESDVHSAPFQDWILNLCAAGFCRR